MLRTPVSRGARGGEEPEERPPAEVLWVWALLALATVSVLETYGRLPAGDLYHVSSSGLVGGFSRALVFVDFPVALVAIAIALVACDRLGGRLAAALAALSVLLSAVAAWPGVVDQSNLDAKAVNALPALGVALAIGLSVWAARDRGVTVAPRLRFDPVRAALAVAFVFAGLPWLLAEVGFSVSEVPGLGNIFLGEQIRPESVGETLQVVHLGHHHGADGLYLVLAALFLSRALPRLGRLRSLISAYVALMLVYGAANYAQDLWTEQVLKRGWTDRAISSLLHPSLSLGWAVIVCVALGVELVVFRTERRGYRG